MASSTACAVTPSAACSASVSVPQCRRWRQCNSSQWTVPISGAGPDERGAAAQAKAQRVEAALAREVAAGEGGIEGVLGPREGAGQSAACGCSGQVVRGANTPRSGGCSRGLSRRGCQEPVKVVTAHVDGHTHHIFSCTVVAQCFICCHAQSDIDLHALA